MRKSFKDNEYDDDSIDFPKAGFLKPNLIGKHLKQITWFDLLLLLLLHHFKANGAKAFDAMNCASPFVDA